MASALLFVSMMGIPASAEKSSVAGKLFPPKESYNPGEWFLGAVPPNLDSSKPPIVFVQGKNGAANSWYGETEYHGVNDMYEYAYNAGYQTVFVQLNDAAGNGSFSPYDNGRLLASMLQEIYQHFGKKVNIVAHSKGGPDTQAALIHSGAYRYVGKAVTLASPHHGSHLADLAYSWYAGWLGTLLGQKDAGTYSLQTGEMANFRSAADSHANASKNRYYTVTGTNRGPALSALAMGGAYLGSYGENDGLVNEWSSRLPYGTHLFTDSRYDHDNIRMGSAVFSRIEPYLRNASAAGASAASADRSESLQTVSNTAITGGPLTKSKKTTQPFYADGNTDGRISILTALKETKVSLISPSGNIYTPDQVSEHREDSFFEGAFVSEFNISNMETGKWQAVMQAGGKEDAFLLLANYEHALSFTLDLAGKVKDGKGLLLLKKGSAASVHDQSIRFSVRLTGRDGKLAAYSENLAPFGKDTYQGILPSVSKSGVYNMTIDITGKNAAGISFSRTLVRSVYIEK